MVIRKQKRNRISRLLLCGLLFLLAAVNPYDAVRCPAQENTAPAVVVADDASLLNEEQEQNLQQLAQSLSDESSWNVIVATCDDAGGETAQTVCETYFNTYTAGDDGISCLVDMDNREIYLATAGMAQYYLNDDRVSDILDAAYEKIADGDEARCLEQMVEKSGEAYRAGIPDNATIYNEKTGETTVYRKLTGGEIFGSVFLALITGLAIFGTVKAKYRRKWDTYQYDYHASGSINIKKKEDILVNQTLTHRKIPKNPPPQESSSGGSSNQTTVHTGAGGRDFGGGGRKF